MSDGNRDRAEQSFERTYDDWYDQLDGKPSTIPANRVGLGFYARRERAGGHIGIAIWAGDDGRPVVKNGHAPAFVLETPAAEEDFSYGTMAWCMAVPEAAYVAWAASGAWPEGTVLDRPKPARPDRRKIGIVTASAAPLAEAVPAAVEVSVEQPEPVAAKVPAVFVRVYATIDPPTPEMAFMARAIARTKSGGEGFSVGFYAATQESAAEQAEAWIITERERVERLHGRSARRRAAATEQSETAGAAA